MSPTVNPQSVADAVVHAVGLAARTVALFAESSSSMFYAIHALCAREGPEHPYYRMSSHYGSMGHAIGGAVGFCAATGQRAAVLTGDGSFHLMNPLPVAVKHGYRIAMIVINDSRLGLPYFGSARVGAHNARATTQLADWDFTRQGSTMVGGQRVSELGRLDRAIAEALSFDGCYVVDVRIDPEVVPPVDARFGSVKAMHAGTRA